MLWEIMFCNFLSEISMGAQFVEVALVTFCIGNCFDAVVPMLSLKMGDWELSCYYLKCSVLQLRTWCISACCYSLHAHGVVDD